MILQECEFDRLTTSGQPAEFCGTVFDRCRFTGKCGRIIIDAAAKDVGSFMERNDRIVADNRQLYETPTEAIDVSTATFAEFEACGVRGKLIRMNQADQFLVDFNLADKCLKSQTIPDAGALYMLEYIHNQLRRFGCHYVHVISRRRSNSLLECCQEIAEILTSNNPTRG